MSGTKRKTSTPKRLGPSQAAVAFTLVELLTIIIILSMLITLAAPSMLEARRIFREHQTNATIGMIADAIGMYQLDWKDSPYEQREDNQRIPLRLKGLPRSDGGVAGGLKGRYALVEALTGYLPATYDGKDGPGARWHKDRPGKDCGPYVGPDMAKGREDGKANRDPAFLDAFGNEIFYYRCTLDEENPFDAADNFNDGPTALRDYLTDPNTNTLYRQDFILITRGADRQWMKRTPELQETDDVANFVFSFRPLDR